MIKIIKSSLASQYKTEDLCDVSALAENFASVRMM